MLWSLAALLVVIAIEIAALLKYGVDPEVAGQFEGLVRVLPYLLSTTLAASLAILATLLNNASQRNAERSQVNRTIYQELLFLTFRCAWDFVGPWSGFYTDGNGFNKNRVQKFRPDDPIVFRSLASKLSLIHSAPLGRIMRFHQCLELWRRDLDHFLFEMPELLEAKEVRQQLVVRLSDALQVGESALQMLRPHVADWRKIEEDFRRSLRPVRRAEASREEFISSMADQAMREIGPPLF